MFHHHRAMNFLSDAPDFPAFITTLPKAPVQAKHNSEIQWEERSRLARRWMEKLAKVKGWRGRLLRTALTPGLW